MNNQFCRISFKGKNQKAATLLEFAIVFPVVLLLVLALIDFILFLVAKGTVERAAKQAAAYAAVVDGLENENNQSVLDLIDKKARELPGMVLSRSLVDINGAVIEYKPPFKDEFNRTGLDYRTYPLGVSIRTNYRPILPFLPKEISVSGYAYREKSEVSSLPVPLDCLGNKLVPGKVPPISRCPCPGVNDPLRRVNPNDPENVQACTCVPGAQQNQPEANCACIGDDTKYDPASDSCVCRIKDAILGSDNICRCPTDRHTVSGNSCVCKQPYIQAPTIPGQPYTNVCKCRFDNCPTNSSPDPANPCACICNNPDPSNPIFIYNPENNRCECKLQADQCPDGTVLVNTNGRCECSVCPLNSIPSADKKRCECDPSFINTCGGASFTEFLPDGSCKCKGKCEFEDENGNPVYSEGNCICDKDLLFARCGGEQNSNLTYCNCKCVNPKPGQKCECNIPALIKWCADPKPQGQGGLPIWREVCGCKSGQCQGITVLRNGICVCPDSVSEEVVRKNCKLDGQEFNPETCACKPATCPEKFINANGTCSCPNKPELIAACKAMGLPVGNLAECSCGAGCGINMEPNEQGVCACSATACPEGATPDPANQCACKCNLSGGAPIKCDGKGGQLACIDDASCLLNPISCSCDANGNFRPKGG